MAKYEYRRGNTTARGYGTHHQRMRKAAKALVDAGGVNCCRCGKPIPPGAPFDLDHSDEDRTKYQGVSHPACNRAAGARKNGSNGPSDDCLYTGMDNVPIGTISNGGRMVKVEPGGWRAVWVHRIVTSGNAENNSEVEF
jgi:hypothetical protein